MNELKPCRCGGEVTIIKFPLRRKKYTVYCFKCERNTGLCETEEEAIVKWNMRLIQRLEAGVKKDDD